MTQIRKARIEDEASLVELFKQLEEETNFMLFSRGERIITSINKRIDSRHLKTLQQRQCS